MVWEGVRECRQGAFKMAEDASNTTESSSLYDGLEMMSVEEITASINAEDRKVADCVQRACTSLCFAPVNSMPASRVNTLRYHAFNDAS